MLGAQPVHSHPMSAVGPDSVADLARAVSGAGQRSAASCEQQSRRRLRLIFHDERIALSSTMEVSPLRSRSFSVSDRGGQSASKSGQSPDRDMSRDGCPYRKLTLCNSSMRLPPETFAA
jgi:hypothetical protein